jgi:serine protease Do
MNRAIFYPSILCLILFSLLSNTAAAALPEFTKLVKKTAPSVVNINARRTKQSSAEQLEGQRMPEPFHRFFRGGPQQRPNPRPSMGSGFIVSEDGYILTNNHVVDGADLIVVSLNDRREREARLVGADALSDLALLKIEADDLPIVEFGSSESLEVGEWVVAIGSPFGFEYSVTAGIVSAKGRSLPNAEANYVPFIQTDVAINPGNSGGPLFNMKGQVVGINSQIFTRSGGFMGLSFAIPIDVAMEVVEQLKESGSVERGWLGVLIQRVDRDLAESFGLDRPSGALINKIFPDSPAEKAGLKEGDIIIEFDGKHIDLSSHLPHVVGRTKVDTEVDVIVMRDRERQTIKLNVGVLPKNRVAASQGPRVQEFESRIGLVVRDVTEEEKEHQAVDYGVVVQRVLEGGAAQEAGIRNGDIITLVDNEIIRSLNDFETLVENIPDNKAVPARIVRRGSPSFLVIKITE